MALFTSGCCVPLTKLVDKARVIPAAASIEWTPKAADAVTESRETWHDAARSRDVPVTIYTPSAPAPHPVVIFSHGIGEDRDSYAYLGRAFARDGYLAVHITHAGTDKAVLRRGYWKLYKATKDPENWAARPQDVSFVIGRLLERGGVDPSRIAVAGHSAGAFTALAVAGLRGDGPDYRDPHVKIAIAMSMPKLGSLVPPTAYEAVAIPILHMTGTCDTSLVYRTFPRDRRVPFEHIHRPDQLLVTIDRVTHDTFSAQEDPRHALIAKIALAFLDEHFRNDREAGAWLERGGLSAVEGVAVEK